MHTLRRRLFTLGLVLLSLTVLLGYTRLVQVSQGGTGASTAAGARDAIEHASAGTIACSSPCTPGAGIKVVTVSGTVTINLPALSTYADGQQILAHCDSASACTVTLDPSDSGTCNGGSAGAACSAISVSARGVVGARRTSASSWGSVQPGAVEGVSEARIRAYVLAGAPLAVLETWDGATWTTLAGPVAPDQTNAGSATQGVTPSGTGFDFSAAYATAADQPTEGNSWVWELDGGGGLGVTVTITDEVLWLSYVGSQPASGTVYAAAGAGVWGGSVGAAGGVYVGAGRSTQKTVQGEGGNTARDLANATVTEPIIGYVLGLNGGDGAHDWQYTTTGTTYTATGTTSAATGATMADPVFGFITMRATLAGASTTITDCVAILPLPAGTWTL